MREPSDGLWALGITAVVLVGWLAAFVLLSRLFHGTWPW